MPWDSDGGDNCTNARDASEVHPVSHRRITNYLETREVHFFDFHAVFY